MGVQLFSKGWSGKVSQVIIKQRPEPAALQGTCCSRQRAQHVQRPEGRNILDGLEAEKEPKRLGAVAHAHNPSILGG